MARHGHTTRPDADSLDRALGIIATARRPLLLAGRGAVRSDAGSALRSLAERLGAPTATTLLSRGFLADDPCHVGTMGSMSSQAGAAVIAEADCIVGFGASLNPDTTSRGTMVDGKRVVQIELDPSRVSRHHDPDAVVIGDARLVAEEMVALLTDLGAEPATFRSDGLAARLRDHRFEDEFTDCSDGEHVDLRTAVLALDRALPDQRSVSIDAGAGPVASAVSTRVRFRRSRHGGGDRGSGGRP